MFGKSRFNGKIAVTGQVILTCDSPIGGGYRGYMRWQLVR